MAPPSHRFDTLDGLRGAAAFAVLLFHCGLNAGQPWIAGHGALAVDVFFVMSGFVVDRAYGERLRAGWPVRSFAALRVARLYPLYVVGVLLGLASHLAQSVWQAQPIPAVGLILATVAAAGLTPLILGGGRQVFPLNGPSWSLFVEALLNAGFAAAPRSSPRSLLAAATLAMAVLAGASLCGVALLGGGRSTYLWVDLIRGTFGFSAGLLLSHAHRSGRLPAAPGRWPAAIALGVLAAAVALPRGPVDRWADPLLIALVCPAIVAAAIAQPSRPGAWRRWCSRAGAVSYPLYLFHAPLVELAGEITRPASAGAPSASGAVALAGALSLGLAAAAARWLEPALWRLSRRLASRASTPAPGIAVYPADAAPPP